MKQSIQIMLFATLIAGCSSIEIDLTKEQKLKEESLGRALFFDKNLSKNKTQSCATCHDIESAFVDKRLNGINAMASLGDNNISIGDRNAPTISYAKFSPAFHFNQKKQKYIGGQFWDGRASTLSVQAGGPPLNPLEMGMSSEEEVIKRVKQNEFYIKTFKTLYGDKIFDDNKKAYKKMGEAIQRYEQSDEFSTFDSKYDRYLKGEYDLTPLEDLGKSLFFSNNNTNCSTCHLLKGEDKEYETFTNYQYHNIGVPTNIALRMKNGIDKKYIDKGLYDNSSVDDDSHIGKFKVPTLRNIAVTSPYMHNGVFSDLKEVIEFYDKYNNKNRTINPNTKKEWEKPEYDKNINLEDLKAKELTDRKIDALIAFLNLLTDKRYEHLIK